MSIENLIEQPAGARKPPAFLRVEIPIMEEKTDRAAQAFRLPDDVKEARLRKVRAKLNQAHSLPTKPTSGGKLLAIVAIVAAGLVAWKLRLFA